jgi:WD40 repeat protein
MVGIAKHILSAASDGTLSLWDVSTDQINLVKVYLLYFFFFISFGTFGALSKL